MFFSKKGFCNYIYFHLIAFIFPVLYIFTKSDLFLLYYFIYIYCLLLPGLFLLDCEEYLSEVLKVGYLSLFFVILNITNSSLLCEINIYYKFLVALSVSLMYTYIIYLSGDGVNIQEIIRILITGFLLGLLYIFTDRITFFVICLSMVILFIYAIGGRWLISYICYITLKTETDSPNYIFNIFFSKIFYFSIIIIFNIRRIKSKFITNIFYRFILRGSIWYITYVFGSKILFIFANIGLLSCLISSTVVEFFISNESFSNILVSCLKKKEAQYVLKAAYELRIGNDHFQKFYNFFSINYYIDANMDRELAIQFKELLIQDMPQGSLENSYFRLFLDSTVNTGENRYFNIYWIYAERLSRERFDSTGDLTDNYVAGFLLQSFKEKAKKLSRFSKKDSLFFELLKNNRDLLIVKNPGWYVNICSGLVL